MSGEITLGNCSVTGSLGGCQLEPSFLLSRLSPASLMKHYCLIQPQDTLPTNQPLFLKGIFTLAVETWTPS